MTRTTATVETLEARQLLAAGDIVRSFGSNGVISIPHAGPAEELLVQPDGRFLVSSGDRIWRFKPNGRLDKSFGTRGVLRAGGGSMALDEQGRILLAGGVVSGQWGFRRFNADGSPDTSLNGDGRASVRIGDDHEESANFIAVAPDGKIVLAGFQDNEVDNPDEWLDRAGHDIAVARFNPDGSVDTTFAGDGEYLTNSFERLNALAVGPQGNILVAGQWNSGSRIHLAFYEEIGPDGRMIDVTGTSGLTGFTFSENRAAAYRPDGAPVAAGTGMGTSSVSRTDEPVGAVVSMNPTDADVTNDSAFTDVIATPDNKLYVAGFTGDRGVPRSGIIRLNPDFTRDSTFGFGGSATFNFARSRRDMFDRIGLLPNGDIIAAGASGFREDHPPTSWGGRLFLTRIEGGSREVGRQRPRAAADLFPPTTAGQSEYQFRVAYAAEEDIDKSTLGDRDVRLVGPGGYRPYGRLVEVEDRYDKGAVIATYAVTPPGGTWDSADNGEYVVVLRRRAVRDNFGNPAVAGAIGSIDVNLGAADAGSVQVFAAPKASQSSLFSTTPVRDKSLFA